ncbi:MAG: Co2+/Mg2+ efflux protein ApaG, partial [Rickettsiales bacterium]|nr:Co2+/Mg2+ efflux protein ApaG [Rickettsiales bacterium]
MKNKKILINVEPIYLEDHSDPSEDSYLWAYKVKIKNNGTKTIKL